MKIRLGLLLVLLAATAAARGQEAVDPSAAADDAGPTTPRRNIHGGVYPISYDGQEPGGSLVEGYPMPFADVEGGGFTDSGGNFEAAGPQTTTLNGKHVQIVDTCGSILEFGDGDIDFEGTDGDVDCDVPPGHSAGDTAAARTAFYELNRISEQARGQLPGNGWLAGQVQAEVNIDTASCFAFWNGSSVITSQEASPCANPGQIAGVLGHEWAHGMDQNDSQGGIISLPQGGPEGIADLYSALRLDHPCIGRGFFLTGQLCGGYGDPCTPASGCTGVRSIDFADRTSGLPHDLSWVRANCNDTPQCVGAASAEAIWDLIKRDLPTQLGIDPNTALEVGTRLTYLGAGNANGWFDLSGPPPDAAGCGASQAYLQYLAADDDDGTLANGTPNMEAIAAAFDRHEIGCTPANGGPTVVAGGCSDNPTAAPLVTASATGNGIELDWDPVADAASYGVYRTDGELACEFGKTRLAATAGSEYFDPEVQAGRSYYYVVIPFGSGGESCFGPASACLEAVDGPLFADGFESGDTGAWDVVVDLVVELVP